MGQLYPVIKETNQKPDIDDKNEWYKYGSFKKKLQNQIFKTRFGFKNY